MPFTSVTVGIKIGRSASRRSACSTPSFSGNVKSQMEREGGVSEARTTNRARGEQALEVLGHPPLRRLVSTRPGRHQRAGQQSRGLHVTRQNFRSTQKSWAQIFVLCHHDETTKKRPKNSLQLTDLEQKEREARSGAKGTKSGYFPVI